MIPEIGHFSLILALLVALVVGTLSVVGGQTGRGDWMALARPGAQVLWLLTAFSFCCLTYAFFTNDFSVSYVAQHSNSRLPGMYRIAGVWGGHEGSLLKMAVTSIHCCRIPGWFFIRRCSTWGTLAWLFLLHLPLRLCSMEGWMLLGRVGRDPGRQPHGCF